MNHSLIGRWHAKKSGFYTTTSTNQKLQNTSQSQTCTKKVTVTVWWSAASLNNYSFLNPRETITFEKYAQQIIEMHQKLQCLQHALVNKKGPILIHDNTWPHTHNQRFTSWMNWATKFCSSTIFTWPLINQLPLLQTSGQLSVGKMLPQPAGGRKFFPRVHQTPKHRFLCYRDKQIYFSLAKMCWL